MSLLIQCPLCGKRNGYEFRYGGEDKGAYPEGRELSAAKWYDYVHGSACTEGVVKEWWCHRLGCGTWFTIYRDTRVNRQVQEPQESARQGNGRTSGAGEIP